VILFPGPDQVMDRNGYHNTSAHNPGSYA
jgi:hypothetical protein